MVDPRFIELLTKELTEELTVAERQELDLLLQQNPQHKKQSATIKEYWNSNNTDYTTTAANFNKLMAVIRFAEQAADMDIEADNETKPRRLWAVALKYAAVLALGVGLYFLYLVVRPANNGAIASNWQNKTTAPREKVRMTLPDGTVVTLNSGTTLSYPLSFGNKNREVYLNGEAFFDVHRDRQHPFIIHTKKMNVRVLGTVFNIKSYDNEPHSETSLIKGSIEVTLNDRIADRIILKPREKLIVENDLPTQNKTNIPNRTERLMPAVEGTQYSLTNLTYLPSIDSAAVETLWLKNKLVFRNENFENIAAEMERWYGVQVVFQHKELMKLRFTAKFEKETAMQVLESLRLTEDFHFKKDGSTFYILK